MTLVSPGINLAAGTDGFDIALWLRDSSGAHHVSNVDELQVTIPDIGLPGIEFQVSKHNKLIDRMQGRFEVSLMVWNRWRSTWEEPPNCRFIVVKVQEDPTDLTAKVKFTGTGIGFLLSGTRVHKGRRDDALVARETAAKEAWDDARREYASRKKAVFNKVSEVRKRRKLWGQMFYQASFPKPTKTNSLLYHAGRKEFYVWRTSTKKWVRLNETSTIKNATSSLYSSWLGYKSTYLAAANVYRRARAAAVEATKGGKRPIVNATAAHALLRHWAEGTARGNRPHSKLTRSFSAGLTSARKKWPLRRDWEIEIGASLLQVVEMLTEAGALEYRFRGRVMDAGPPGAFRVNQAERIHLRYGVDIESGDAVTDYAKHAGYALVRGDGDKTFGVRASTTDPKWGIWEETVTASGAKTRAQAVSGTRGHRRESSRQFLNDDSFSLLLQPGRAKPLVDYLPGHMIRVDTPAGSASMAVRQVTLSRDVDGRLSGSIIVGHNRNAAVQLGRNVVKGLDGASAQIGVGRAVPDIDPGWPEQLAVAAPPIPATSATVAADPVTGRYTVNLDVVWADESAEDIPEEDEAAFVDDVNVED